MIILLIAVGGWGLYLWFRHQKLDNDINQLKSQLEEYKKYNASLVVQIKGCQLQNSLLHNQLEEKRNALEKATENPELYAAYEAISRGENVFIHGKAGTGKSAFIKGVLQKNLSHTAYVTCTNIAALNIRGQTIYRFLSATPSSIFKPLKQWDANKSLEVLAKIPSIKTLVIDEISMLHSKVFDALDARLREIKKSPKPFGGMQVVLLGDLFQLPPIETEKDKTSRFVFSSKVYSQLNIHFFELQKVYRQQDAAFSSALDIVRSGEGNIEEAVQFINENSAVECPRYAPCLYPYRAAVDERNKKELAKLQGKSVVFVANCHPQQAWRNESDLPAPRRLEIKPKAPVIFLANDLNGEFVNSDVGVVSNITSKGEISIWNVRTQKEVHPRPYTWYQTKLNDNGEQEENHNIFFQQYPFQLAYAVTIHKAQGLTLESASINFGKRTFEMGQAYVALSRVKRLDGLYLEKPLTPYDFKISDEVKTFLLRQKAASRYN